MLVEYGFGRFVLVKIVIYFVQMVDLCFLTAVGRSSVTKLIITILSGENLKNSTCEKTIHYLYREQTLLGVNNLEKYRMYNLTFTLRS